MRVISGKARGRKLQAPKGATTRPTPDRVKEALFSMLQGEVSGARILDLFAGSGALGIEALSRGASHATFVEQDRHALAALTANLAATQGAAEAYAVVGMPVQRALGALAARRATFDIILLDPPYPLDLVPSTLALLVQHQLLAPRCTVVAEHLGKSPSPAAPDGLVCTSLRRYGDVALSFYNCAQSGLHHPPSPRGGS